jgi:hypothetical protein
MSKRTDDRAPRPPAPARETGAARQAEPRSNSDEPDCKADGVIDDIVVGDVFGKRPGNRWMLWEALDQETEQ